MIFKHFLKPVCQRAVTHVHLFISQKRRAPQAHDSLSCFFCYFVLSECTDLELLSLGTVVMPLVLKLLELAVELLHLRLSFLLQMFGARLLFLQTHPQSLDLHLLQPQLGLLQYHRMQMLDNLPVWRANTMLIG